MLSTKILPFLLLFAFLLSPTSSSHGIDITPRIIEDPHPRKFLKYSSVDYKPLNITFDFSNVDGDYRRTGRYLNETIFPVVQTFFKSALKVLPRSSKIFVKPNDCGDSIKVPKNASKDGYDTDLIIFVKFVFSAKYLASSTSCLLDGTTRRPVVGMIIFNESPIVLDGREAASESHTSMTIHEIIHILGFSNTLFPYYINPDTLQPLTGHFFNKTVNGVETLVLDVPPLTQRVRDYFSCPSAKGAYLENQGGSGSLGSHFERRVFGNEVMTSSEMVDNRISEFSLGLLEGTGWYKVDYQLAETMTYGKNRGCDFLNKKCMNKKTHTANFPEFCSPLAAKGISWTGRGYGFCGTGFPQANSDLISEFDYWGNQTAVADEFSDNCPSIVPSHQNDCEDIKYTYLSSNLQSYEFRGPGSRAFMGSLAWPSDYNQHYGYCFKTKCVLKPENSSNYELQVQFGMYGNVTCKTAGNIDASDFDFETNLVGALECPDPKEFCEKIEAEKFCKFGCFGNGRCSERECKCKDGWGSGTCRTKQEVLNSSRCVEDNLRTAAYGDDCICSEQNMTCQCLLGLKQKWECNLWEWEKQKENEKKNQPSENQYTGVVFVIAGLVVVVIAILLIKKNKSKKEANGMNISLSKEPLMSDQVDKIEPAL